MIVLLASSACFAAGCATHWVGLTKIADEGRGVIRQGQLDRRAGSNSGLGRGDSVSPRISMIN